MYITDIANWICGYPYYLTNRFSLCKHLVQKKGIVTAEFFTNIKRNYQPQFLIEDNPLPHINNEQNFHEDEELHIMDESNEDSNELFDDLINTTRKALSLLEEQKLAGNIKWYHWEFFSRADLRSSASNYFCGDLQPCHQKPQKKFL